MIQKELRNSDKDFMNAENLRKGLRKLNKKELSILKNVFVNINMEANLRDVRLHAKQMVIFLDCVKNK